MGAIARNIANKITTSGVFTSGAIANSSVTGITVLANASDGITFISSQTASNSASISFTSGLTSTYKAYKFVLVNVHPVSQYVDLVVDYSTDSGSNYNVVQTTTFFGAYHAESDAYADIEYYASNDVAQGTSPSLVDNAGSASDASISGSLTLFNPSSTTYVKHWIASMSLDQNGVQASAYTAGYANTTSAINAIRFSFVRTAVNFDGTIYLYGIK
jgi:hypothetical protein